MMYLKKPTSLYPLRLVEVKTFQIICNISQTLLIEITLITLTIKGEDREDLIRGQEGAAPQQMVELCTGMVLDGTNQVVAQNHQQRETVATAEIGVAFDARPHLLKPL